MEHRDRKEDQGSAIADHGPTRRYLSDRPVRPGPRRPDGRSARFGRPSTGPPAADRPIPADRPGIESPANPATRTARLAPTPDRTAAPARGPLPSALLPRGARRQAQRGTTHDRTREWGSEYGRVRLCPGRPGPRARTAARTPSEPPAASLRIGTRTVQLERYRGPGLHNAGVHASTLAISPNPLFSRDSDFFLPTNRMYRLCNFLNAPIQETAQFLVTNPGRSWIKNFPLFFGIARLGRLSACKSGLMTTIAAILPASVVGPKRAFLEPFGWEKGSKWGISRWFSSPSRSGDQGLSSCRRNARPLLRGEALRDRPGTCAGQSGARRAPCQTSDEESPASSQDRPESMARPAESPSAATTPPSAANRGSWVAPGRIGRRSAGRSRRS